MAITKDKKKEVLDKVSGIVKDAGSVVFVNFHGLTMPETTELRGKLIEQGVGYTVAKKTLVKRALDGAAEGSIPELDGELAIAYVTPETGGTDVIAPARETYTFGKSHDGKLAILGGIFEGKFMSREEMTEIATIPSMQTLRGMFVNVINSPIQGLAVALNAIAEKKA